MGKGIVGIYNSSLAVFWFIIWMVGVVMAKGGWSTFFAICTGGLWSFYMVVEKILTLINWV